MGILMIGKGRFSAKQMRSLAAGAQKIWIMFNIFIFSDGFYHYFSHYNKITYKWKQKRLIFDAFCGKPRASSNFELKDAVFDKQHHYMVYSSNPQRGSSTCSIRMKIKLLKVCQILNQNSRLCICNQHKTRRHVCSTNTEAMVCEHFNVENINSNVHIDTNKNVDDGDVYKSIIGSNCNTNDYKQYNDIAIQIFDLDLRVLVFACFSLCQFLDLILEPHFNCQFY